MKPRESAASSAQFCSVRNCSRGWPVDAPKLCSTLPFHCGCGATGVHGLHSRVEQHDDVVDAAIDRAALDADDVRDGDVMQSSLWSRDRHTCWPTTYGLKTRSATPLPADWDRAARWSSPAVVVL